MLPAKLVGSLPVTKLWVQFYLYRRIAQDRSSEQEIFKNHLFLCL